MDCLSDFFSACNKQDLFEDFSETGQLLKDETIEMAEPTRVDLIVESHLRIIDGYYSFDLSEAEALTWGISKEKYAEVITALDETNRMISNARNEGTEVTMADPQAIQQSRAVFAAGFGDLDPVFESEYPRYVGTQTLNEYGSYTSLSFSCGSRIALIGSSTSPIWSIQVKNLTTGTNHVMTGTRFTSDTLYLNQQNGNWMC